jgi:hypothetical protein
MSIARIARLRPEPPAQSRAAEEPRVSAKSKTDRPLSNAQFWAILVSMALAGVLALIVLSSVAGKHGKCPGETQVSRPGASSCWSAYQHQISTGVAG